MRKMTAFLAIAFAMLSLGLPATSAAVLSVNPSKSTADNTSSSGDTSAQKSAPEVAITSVGAPILAPDTDLDVTLKISNPTDSQVTVTRIDLRSGMYSPVTHAQVFSWMSEETSSALLMSTNVEIAVKPGKSTAQRVTLPADQIPWPNGAFDWGPRGIEIVVTLESGGEIRDRSMIVVESTAELKHTPTTVVVPITQHRNDVEAIDPLDYTLTTAENSSSDSSDTDVATPDSPDDSATSSDPSADEESAGNSDPTANTEPDEASSQPESESTSSSSGEDGEGGNGTSDSESSDEPVLDDLSLTTSVEADRLERQVRSLSQPGVALFIDPALLAHEEIGSAVLQSQADIQLLPMFDADLAALAHIPHDEAAITSLDLARETASEIGIDANAEYLLPEHSVDLDTLTFAQELGLSGAIIPTHMTTRQETANYQLASATTSVDSGLPMDVLVANSSISKAMTGELTSGSSDTSIIELDALDSRQLTLVLSAVQFRERPNDPRGIVIQLPRGELTGTSRTNTHALLDAPWVDAVSLAEHQAHGLPALTAQDLPTTAINPGEIGVDDFAALALALDNSENFASIMVNPETVREAASMRANWITGIVWRDQPDLRMHQILGIDPGDVLNPGVSVQPSSTINMISESSALPLHVTNSLPMPVNVVIELDTPDSRLRAPKPVDMTIPAQTTVPVSVPVEAWGSGNLNVIARVTNAKGVAVGVEQELHVRVRADWENVGTAVIAGGVLLLFIVGVIKSIRDGRRSKPVSPETFSAHLEEVRVEK